MFQLFRATYQRFLVSKNLICFSGVDINDDEYKINQKRFLVHLHLGYLFFLLFYLPYSYWVSPCLRQAHLHSLRLFLFVTVGFSILCLTMYAVGKYLRPLYLSLALYGLALPYVIWGSQGCYSVYSVQMLPWGFVGVMLVNIIGTPTEALLYFVLFNLLPFFALLIEFFGSWQCSSCVRAASLCVGQVTFLSVITLAVEYLLPYEVSFFTIRYLLTLFQYTKDSVQLKQALAERLLLNILPQKTADQLMSQLSSKNPSHLSELLQNVTVCFCDICGFTALSLQVSPSILVSTLNGIFSIFDMLCMDHHVEKIKTIGDAYMMAGFPSSDSRESYVCSAINVIDVAMGMLRVVKKFTISGSSPTHIRVGAHTGSVVAGVIGCTKFCYDLWGPVVNMASRLESNGVSDRIQVSTSTAELISQKYECTYRDTLPLKGAGSHPVYLVVTPPEGGAGEGAISRQVDQDIGLPDILAISRLDEHRRLSICTLEEEVGNFTPSRYCRKLKFRVRPFPTVRRRSTPKSPSVTPLNDEFHNVFENSVPPPPPPLVSRALSSDSTQLNPLHPRHLGTLSRNLLTDDSNLELESRNPISRSSSVQEGLISSQFVLKSGHSRSCDDMSAGWHNRRLASVRMESPRDSCVYSGTPPHHHRNSGVDEADIYCCPRPSQINALLGEPPLTDLKDHVI